jgi:hypothetical protein
VRQAAALVLAALALTLTACESNQERSAKIEKAQAAHDREVTRHLALTERALSITHPSTKVEVIGTTVLRGSEGAAAVLTLRNLSATTLRDVPIEITVKDAQGATVYTNDTPGLATGLNAAPLVPAHATTTWIDDQVQATSTPASVTAKVGEGTPATGAIPSLSVEGAHQYTDPTNGPAVEGSIVNHSHVGQQELIVDALVRRGGTIVAAGRAVLPTAPVGASTRFQLFFTGNPHGGQLEVQAPATTLG